ncbi:cadherin-like beta sandwich domain-containing protein [Clostridium sp. D33t1_170424_F3]|uniref:cadherin-like beta sandwich domain-containing protein n=1 Tax=Clostridium sp. D33t1_170424_F3 TaxID=2787099 RepID=UPI0018A961E9|nr:cadherin-like beta sandwich domain-containing protein [Clostridium sp. D33t1_170424_F3]
MLRKVLLFLLVFLFGVISFPVHTGLAAEEYFQFAVDSQEYRPGDKLYLSIDAQEQEEVAAGFRICAEYDDTRLSFVRVDMSDQIKSKTLYTDSSGNPVRSTYVCNVDMGRPPELSGTIITYVFEVKEGAAAGETDLRVHMDQICNWDGVQLNRNCDANLSFTILTAKSGKAYLNALKPSSGKLEPAFSPDTLDYALNVPSSVSTVEFQAEAAENGSVKVSRKTLQKAGSATTITITALSENEKERTQYVVTVNRAAVPEEEAYLVKLEPSHGVLRPSFSSDILEYSIDVDADVQYVTFSARAGEDGSVSINREKLNRAGTSTEIKITALSSDKKNRVTYTVTVNRGEVPVDSSVAQVPYLTALQPSEGVLEPAFSPDTFTYFMRVSSETREVIFQAGTSPGATVTINRRTLFKAGSETDIVVTVRSENGKEKAEYVVTVYREEETMTAQVGSIAGTKSKGQTMSKSSSLGQGEKWNETGPMGDSPEEETYDPETPSEVQAVQPEEQRMEPLQQAGSVLLREGNQLPVFLAGMGGTLLCIVLGAGLVLLVQRFGKNSK